MQTIFSTSDVEPQHRFDYWHSVACEQLNNHDAVPDDPMAFTANLKYGTLGDIELILSDNSPMKASHTLHHIAGRDTEHMFLCRQVVGRVHLEQAGRSILLESGDVVLLDPWLPGTAIYPDSSRLLILKMPRRLLNDRLGDPRDLIARPIKRTRGESVLMSTFLATLPNHVANLDKATTRIAIEYLLGLLARALGRERRTGSPHRPQGRPLEQAGDG
jgi:AraC family transcriptional activator of tynA and feaB